MAHYMKHNRDNKSRRKMSSSKDKYEQDELEYKNGKKKKKLNLKELREGEYND